MNPPGARCRNAPHRVTPVRRRYKSLQSVTALKGKGHKPGLNLHYRNLELQEGTNTMRNVINMNRLEQLGFLGTVLVALMFPVMTVAGLL
jgi:hypothetical protein